jgi:hypothetical protein
MQITVEGTIAPWLWNGSNYYQGQLIDPGLFGPAGQSLTGDAIQILWNSDPVSAAITINGSTLTLESGVYTAFTPTYQNITVCNCIWGNVAINSYDDPAYVMTYNPYGLGGSLELLGPNASCNVQASDCSVRLDGYYFINPVPGPIAGSGLVSLLIGVLAWRIVRCHTKSFARI